MASVRESSFKLCGLCSQLVDESVEVSTSMKPFLCRFLNFSTVEELPSKVCLECFQGATECLRFKARCHKTIEKLAKCKVSNDMILGGSELFPPDQFRSGHLMAGEQSQIGQSSQSKEGSINVEPDNHASEVISSSTSGLTNEASSGSPKSTNEITTADGEIVDEDEACSTVSCEKHKIEDGNVKCREVKETPDEEKSLISIKNSRASSVNECSINVQAEKKNPPALARLQFPDKDDMLDSNKSDTKTRVSCLSDVKTPVSTKDFHAGPRTRSSGKTRPEDSKISRHPDRQIVYSNSPVQRTTRSNTNKASSTPSKAAIGRKPKAAIDCKPKAAVEYKPKADIEDNLRLTRSTRTKKWLSLDYDPPKRTLLSSRNASREDIPSSRRTSREVIPSSHSFSREVIPNSRRTSREFSNKAADNSSIASSVQERNRKVSFNKLSSPLSITSSSNNKKNSQAKVDTPRPTRFSSKELNTPTAIKQLRYEAAKYSKSDQIKQPEKASSRPFSSVTAKQLFKTSVSKNKITSQNMVKSKKMVDCDKVQTQATLQKKESRATAQNELKDENVSKQTQDFTQIAQKSKKEFAPESKNKVDPKLSNVEATPKVQIKWTEKSVAENNLEKYMEAKTESGLQQYEFNDKSESLKSPLGNDADVKMSNTTPKTKTLQETSPTSASNRSHLKRRRRSVSPKGRSDSCPPAKKLKQWPGWVWIEEPEVETSLAATEKESALTTRTSSGRTIRARKMSEYVFEDDGDEKVQIKEFLPKSKNPTTVSRGRPRSTDRAKNQPKQVNSKQTAKKANASKPNNGTPVAKPTELIENREMSEEVDVVDEGDLNLANRQEIFPSVGPYQCEICQLITNTKSDFVDHIKQNHPDVVDEEVMASLEMDLRIQRMKAVLLAQLAKTNTEPETRTGPTTDMNASRKSNSQGKRVVECNICGVQLLEGKSKMERHQNTKSCKNVALQNGYLTSTSDAHPDSQAKTFVGKKDEMALHTSCQYCKKVLEKNEVLSLHYQSQDCLSARYIQERKEINEAVTTISNDNYGSYKGHPPTNDGRMNTATVSTTANKMNKTPVYENATVHNSAKQSYADQVFEFNEEMLEPNNFFNVDQASVTFYTDGSDVPNSVSAQHLQIPVVSTAADSTTRGNNFPYAIDHNVATGPQAPGVDNNVNSQVISPINAPAMSMPLMTNTDITTPEPSTEESISMTNAPSPVEDAVQPLVIDTQPQSEEPIACDNPRSPTSSLTSDVLSSIIESTVCSSEQHNTPPAADNEKEAVMEMLCIPSATCVPSSSNELEEESSNVISTSAIVGSGDANIAPLETLLKGNTNNSVVESQSSVVEGCNVSQAATEPTIESSQDKDACAAGDNQPLWINSSITEAVQGNYIPPAATDSSTDG